MTWQDDPILPGSGNQFTAMRAATTRDAVQTSSGDPVAGLASAAKTLAASYSYPYNGHLPIGPMCCVADVTPSQTTIFSSTQDIENLANTVSSVLGVTPKQVRVLYYEGSGSYGSNTQEDVAESAAIMSQAIGKPVRVQFMRWDEHGWDYYGPEHTADLTAGVDANGNIVGYSYNGWQIPYYTQLTPDELLGKPTPDPTPGLHRIRVHRPEQRGRPVHDPEPPGDVEGRAGAGRRLLQGDVPAGPERAAGAVRVGADDRRARPRRQHGPGRVPPAEHRDERRSGRRIARRRRLGRRARRGRQGRRRGSRRWRPRSLGTGNVVTGRGVALGGFANSQVGLVADVTVNKKTGKIGVTHLYAAQINGLTISPGLVQNQMSGNLIQGLSRGLFEQVAYNKSRVTSLDWVSYPILRFKDSPPVTTVSIQRTDLPSTGSGEPVNAPVAAAVANAFFDATGVRIRQAPMTPAHVRAALKAAGVA